MAEKIYANGIFFNPKHEKQPDFVLGSLSILKEKFGEWLASQEADSRGYIRLQILNGREDKPYLVVDTYKATPKQEQVTNLAPDESDDTIPF